ncbi:MAG: helix-turn-helix domain-containing protein, partial [Dehalobacterium sp.]
EKFLVHFSEEVGCKLTLSSHVIRILHSYDWPGNVRELQNVLEHAVILRNGPVIEPQHLPVYLRPNENECPHIKDGLFNLKQTVAQVEREVIIAALKNNNDNKSNAIKDLGISRRAFYEKLYKYNIEAKRKKCL